MNTAEDGCLRDEKPQADCNQEPGGTATGEASFSCFPSTTTQDEERRLAANKLGYDAVVRWRTNEHTKLEAYRTRALALLSVSGLILAIGAQLSTDSEQYKSSAAACAVCGGLAIIAIGVLATLVGVVRLIQPLSAKFEENPTYFTKLDTDPDKLRTTAEVYSHLAENGQEECEELTRIVGLRCNWLYSSIFGLFLVLVGVVLIWINGV